MAQIFVSEAKHTDTYHACSYLCSQLPLISLETHFPFVIYQYSSYYLFQFSLCKEKEGSLFQSSLTTPTFLKAPKFKE